MSNKTIISIVAFLTALGLYSCADDKYYDMGGTVSDPVYFKAVNLDVESSETVESTSYRYFNNYDVIRQFPLTVCKPYSLNGTEMTEETVEIALYNENELWSGGYNEIKITFEPSTPEEKEAKFSMPDGSTHTTTKENPTFTWTPDSTWSNHDTRVENTYIKAESYYVKGKTEYKNVGYIYVQTATNIRFNKETNKWYVSEWLNEGPLYIYSYVKFSAENRTIGDPDRCISYNNIFPETEDKSSKTINIPYTGYLGNERVYEATITGKDLFLCGNNDICFTFIPENGSTEMELIFPNGEKVTLTEENPSYIWHVTKEEAIELSRSSYEFIEATSEYVRDGMTFKCRSVVHIKSTNEIWYDPESGCYRSEYRS